MERNPSRGEGAEPGPHVGSTLQPTRPHQLLITGEILYAHLMVFPDVGRPRAPTHPPTHTGAGNPLGSLALSDTQFSCFPPTPFRGRLTPDPGPSPPISSAFFPPSAALALALHAQTHLAGLELGGDGGLDFILAVTPLAVFSLF